MSHQSKTKLAKFAAAMEVQAKEPEFIARQAEYEQRVAASNTELTQALADCRAKGVAPSPELLAKFPSPEQSPIEELRREIYAGMAV
jgi:hypothetical protein